MRFPITYLLYVLVGAYFLWQGLYPLYLYEHYWPYALIFWEDWQTLTAAMIALCASAIVLHTTQYEEETQRKRNFIASRAFLPHAFASLTHYCDDCIKIYCDCLLTSERNNLSQQVPESAYKTIKENILYASPTVGEYLSKVVGEFQVQNSRFHSYFNDPEDSRVRPHTRVRDAYHEILNTIRIRHLVSCMTDFARGESEVFTCQQEPKMNFWFDFYLQEDFRASEHLSGLREYYNKNAQYFTCAYSPVKQNIFLQLVNKLRGNFKKLINRNAS